MACRWLIVFVAGVITSCLLTAPADAKRVALVIANGKYTNASSLKNPASDARLIAASLKNAGFNQVDVRIDLGKTAMEAELRSFGQSAEGADVALIYYAGHGIEAGGQNYLIPTDAKLERDRDLEIEATRLDTALLMAESARLKIVVLDACRNNPFVARMVRTMRTRAVGRGLAAVEPEGETLVVYAAKAGATAADGDGANSPFAESLAKRLVQPGLEISLLFRAVRDDVLATTGRTQEPFTYGSLSGTAFYFVPGAAGPQLAASAVQASPTVSSATTEALFWQGAMGANSAAAFRDYLKRYPKGLYANLARENIARLAAPVAAPPPPISASSGVFGAGLALPNFASAFSGNPTAPPGNGDIMTRYAFRPSASVRKQATEKFLNQLGSTNKQMAELFRAVFGLQDVFGAMDKAVSKYDLSTSNLADTLTIFFNTLHDSATGKITDPTRAQAQGVRRQMALSLSTSPEIAGWSDAQKQEYSDMMMLNAMVMSAGMEAIKNDPAQLKTYSDAMAENAKSTMGLDLRQLRLSDDGYQM
jgi:uncharacterized caspase-like protein